MAMQEHVWLTPEFSVRRETLCMHEKTKLAPGADYRLRDNHKPTGLYCLKGADHPGKHEFSVPDIRLYPFTEARR